MDFANNENWGGYWLGHSDDLQHTSRYVQYLAMLTHLQKGTYIDDHVGINSLDHCRANGISHGGRGNAQERIEPQKGEGNEGGSSLPMALDASSFIYGISLYGAKMGNDSCIGAC